MIQITSRLMSRCQDIPQEGVAAQTSLSEVRKRAPDEDRS